MRGLKTIDNETIYVSHDSRTYLRLQDHREKEDRKGRGNVSRNVDSLMAIGNDTSHSQ